MSNKNSNTPIQVHHFNVQDAIEYGMEKAVLKYNIEFWLAHNRANNANFHDGHWWTYNSAEAFQLLIPYMNSKKISRLLKELEKNGVIIVGNYNKNAYDRTKWYSTPCCKPLLKNEQCISQKGEMDFPNLSNAFPKNKQPIPDINQIKNPDINTNTNSVCKDKNKVAVLDERKILVNQLFDTWLKVSGQRIKPSAKRLSHINARLDDGFTPDQIVAAMTYVATDSWHFDNGNNTIELAIRSTEQIEKKLIKAKAIANNAENKGNYNAKSTNNPISSAVDSSSQQLSPLQAEIQRLKAERDNESSNGLRTVS